MTHNPTEFDMLLLDLETAKQELELLEDYYSSEKKSLLECINKTEKALETGDY